MVKFPLSFEVKAQTKAGITSNWQSQAHQIPPIPCSIPPDFGGSGKGYSPEDLFALSVLNCIIATFKVYCERSGQTFEDLEGKAVAQMGKHPQDNCLAMTHIDIYIQVKGSSHAEKVKEILDKSIKECAISNSINSGKTFHLEVN